MLNYDISRMKSRAEFGTIKTVEDDTITGSTEYYVPQFTVWCGEYTNTQAQSYDLLGTHIDLDIVIAIRHNPQVNNNRLLVKYDGVQYKIVNINSDDRLNAYDLVTLKRSKVQYDTLPDNLKGNVK